MTAERIRHPEAVAAALADAPAVDAELSRAMRDLLAGYAVRAREDRELDESRSRPA